MSIGYEGNPDGKPMTMYDKIWRDHLVHEADGNSLIYIDRHLIHEVTSPQAFEGLRLAGRKVRRPDCSLATVDHNVPTDSRKNYKDSKDFIKEHDSRNQVVTLEENVAAFGLTFFGLDDKRQGIVHVIGPEQGFTLPGTTLVCGDSHTSTHGAFGALAFGIGTSEVEHVLATQTLPMKASKNMRVTVMGKLADGVLSKDVALHIIGLIGTSGGNGHVVEFAGTVFEKMSMEGRMSVCNMTIEAGARAGMVAPDQTTFDYLKGRSLSPKGADWDKAVAYWKTLKTDAGSVFDKEILIDAIDIAPTVTWGTNPEDTIPITGYVPDPAKATDPTKQKGMERSLEYMGLKAGQKMDEIPVNMVFIGSCTNSRMEDLRVAAKITKGHKVAKGVRALVVPGSGLVKQQAEAEGLDKIFLESGWEWREPGCSMCLGMNPDKVAAQDRCASTSNRNFEGRQGAGSRTHLLSPAMAAAAAITGKLTDCRQYVSSLVPDAKSAPKALAPTKAYARDPYQLPAADKQEATSAVATGGGAGASAPAATGGMPKFTVLDAVVAAPLRKANVDTDCIIPKQFLKTIKRTGLGVAAFFELRYEDDGVTERPDFVLNKDAYRKSKILIAMENFGCGSSREHAPWALNDFGIQCVIAPSFADIFFNNCFKNGMLPIPIPKEKVEQLMCDAEANLPITVDLPAQVVKRKNGETIPFEVDSFRKHCLVNGLDDIGLTLQKKDHITKFEARRRTEYCWLESTTAGSGIGEVKITPDRKFAKASGGKTQLADYTSEVKGFFAGIAASEDQAARPPVAQVLISGMGAAIEKATKVAFAVQDSGEGTIAKVATELVDEPLKNGDVVQIPQVVITVDAPLKAKAIIAAPVGEKAASGGGCCGGKDKATEW